MCFALYHQQCWSEEHKATTDLLMQTESRTLRYKKIRRRLRHIEVYMTQHNRYPTEFDEEDGFISEDEPHCIVSNNFRAEVQARCPWRLHIDFPCTNARKLARETVPP